MNWVLALGEGEVAKTGRERANELLRSGRLVFLETAGYTAAQITGLGDLALVPSQKVSSCKIIDQAKNPCSSSWKEAKDQVTCLA
jgi:hypothetical protein